KTVHEGFPAGATMASIERGLMAVTQGNFKGLAHETKGLASIYQLADGKRTLRLTDFETSNGPDVHVYLTAAEIEKGNDAIKQAGFIDLGSMKGNKGDQNYDIPADVDLNKYKNVTIWCARFGVNFATAPLASAKS
ncbi:MAG TPA: DM13 domain-containing protein, partial [Candidatus Binatia bacterium]|nr:DM13 domain-containing protein [Candidatus Binatia bacterium]